VPEALGGKPLAVKPVPLPKSAACPDKREFVVQETLAASRAAVQKAEATLKGADPNNPQLELLRLDVEVAKAKHEALAVVLAIEALEEAGKNDLARELARTAGQRQREAAHLEARRNFQAAMEALLALGANPDPKKLPTAEANVAKADKGLKQAEAAMKAEPPPPYTPRPIKTYPATSTGPRLALARWIADPD